MEKFLSTVILLTGFLYANQVGLECTKVKRGSCEALICNSDELMELDKKLAAAYKEIKVKGVKQMVADRMFASLQTTAQLTLNASADARAILAYRKECKAASCYGY